MFANELTEWPSGPTQQALNRRVDVGSVALAQAEVENGLHGDLRERHAPAVQVAREAER
jgi:hypothetical protein